MNFPNILLNRNVGYKRLHDEWFHLYKCLQEEALIYDIRSKDDYFYINYLTQKEDTVTGVFQG